MDPNTVMTISVLVMLTGVGVVMGVFRTIGPITTERGMKRLGAAIIVLGFLIGLSQSTPI